MKNVIYVFLSIIVINVILAIIGVKILNVNIGVILIAFLIVYSFFSFGTVEVGEAAAMFFFGAPVDNLKPGLYFAPLGIIKVKKLPGTFTQRELPADPEKIFRGDGAIPDGLFPPIRIKFGMPNDDDPEPLKNDPYNVSIVADVVPVVSWRINNTIRFLETMGTIENCLQILSDKAVETFGDDLSKMTPAKALLNLRSISQRLEDQLKGVTMTWGIDLTDAYVKPFNFSHALNDAVVDVVKEGQKAKGTIIRSEAKKKEMINEGIGFADALQRKLKAEAIGQAEIKKLILEAEAIGIAKLIKVSKTPEGQVVLWMKSLQTAFEKAQYSIVPGSELFTAASGIKEMIEKVTGGGKK